MPKILINEVDSTSAGTPGRYGNYAVLITGYAGTPVTSKGNVIEPDANNVYEFSSKGDFEATIGIVEDVAKKDANGNVVEYHYGNRMAAELLNLGYQVIYKVINRISDMNSENFWGIFKDKASYDFRFISHGMLETCYDAEVHSALHTRLEVIEKALAKLADIETKAAEDVAKDKTLEYLEQCQKYFADLVAGGDTSFIDNAGSQYSSYILAAGVDETDISGETLTGTGLPLDKDEIETRLAEHNNRHFTIDVFNNINGYIAKLATYRTDDTAVIPGRGDCIALIELDEDTYCEAALNKRPETLIVEGIENMSSITKAEGPNCAMTVPSVYYKMNNKAIKFPGAFHYLACFMNSLRSGYAEWYAAAGYNRGVSSYAIDHTSVKLGEIAINTLEPRSKSATGPKFACNVIANFRGSYYLWGNRTAAELDENDLTAEHFLNIRQLCTTIKKQLYVACRRFTFDPNSDALWFNFINAITPTLDAMKADQGIRDYKVVKVFTDKKAALKAKIRIIPIEAVEDFDITVSLEDSFGGVSVTAED